MTIQPARLLCVFADHPLCIAVLLLVMWLVLCCMAISKLKDALQGLLQMMPPEARLSILAFFVKGIDINVTFANLADFLRNIPDGGRGPGQDLRNAISEVGNIPIADLLPQVMHSTPHHMEGGEGVREWL
jgi:hypothetical protein